MAGQILGDRYQIEKQLGKKLGRWTFLACDLKTQQPVVLRLLFMDADTSADELKLFKREIAALQTLTLATTPKYLEYFEIDLPKDGKALALIQTYLEGTSLQDYFLQKQYLNERAAKYIARSVLEILQHLHDRTPSIIHRDINPSNILINHSAHAKLPAVYLVDFGSVKSFYPSHEQTHFNLVGTSGYRPPEQIGRRAVQSSDLYSLGVTLIVGMTGFEPANLPRQGFHIDVAQILDATPALVNWLQQMTEPTLERRFKSAQAALAVLSSVG
jgi:eukaryotic-like serine/threonine-protein kinase